jgi:hypothetical protein
VSAAQAAGALAAGVLLWCLYFALGFRAFSRGMQANGLGLLLTVGLPLLAGCCEGAFPSLTAFVPPGSVYAAAARLPGFLWVVGPFFTAVLTLLLGRVALAKCDPELRRWYELHSGRKVMT